MLECRRTHAVRDFAGERRGERRESDHDDDPDVAQGPPAEADAERKE